MNATRHMVSEMGTDSSAGSDVSALESALSMLLGAAAACRSRPVDATTRRVVQSALAPLLDQPLSIDVHQEFLRTGPVSVADPCPGEGLCARLTIHRLGGLVLYPSLSDEDLDVFLGWMGTPNRDPRTLEFDGLSMVPLRTPRTPDGLEQLVDRMGRDPATGLNLLDLPSPAPARSSRERLRSATSAVRDRLGRARLAALELAVRKSASPLALAEAWSAWSAGGER